MTQLVLNPLLTIRTDPSYHLYQMVLSSGHSFIQVGFSMGSKFPLDDGSHKFKWSVLAEILEKITDFLWCTIILGDAFFLKPALVSNRTLHRLVLITSRIRKTSNSKNKNRCYSNMTPKYVIIRRGRCVIFYFYWNSICLLSSLLSFFQIILRKKW